MKTLQDLNIEYWGRVHDMCKGTSLEGREWECVKLSDSEFSSKFYTHPDFNQSGKWEFAIAFLEGKPVFFRDRVYFKLDGSVYIIDENIVSSNIEKFFTWGHPPAKKRTFMVEFGDDELSSLIMDGGIPVWLHRRLTEARDKE